MKKKQILIYSLLFLGINIGKAQYTVLHNFNDTTGGDPTGSLTLLGNVLYGMTPEGGANNDGCIFRIDTNGSGYQDIFDFDSIHGEYSHGSLTTSGSKLYGMTVFGGIYNEGTIFSINIDGSGYKNLYDFNNSIYSSSIFPTGSLMLNGKVLYGMTRWGGAYNQGCIFSIDTEGNGYLDLHDFDAYYGSFPSGSLIISGGILYGMTYQGGVGNTGIIFSIDTDGSSFKDMYNFDFLNSVESGGILGSLTLSRGVLYGMTSQGGYPMYFGNIFSIDTNGNGYKDLFDFDGTNGKMPEGSLTLSGGMLYGMTYVGTLNKGGNVFCIDTNGNGFRQLLDFNGTDGQDPMGDLTLSGNTLYGMTSAGGIYNNVGVIFKIDTSARYVTSVNEVEATNGGIKVEPNPNNGRFFIEMNNEELRMNNRVEVYNVLGDRVYNATLTPQTPVRTGTGGPKGALSEIDISGQANGVYFYRVINESGELAGNGKVEIQK